MGGNLNPIVGSTKDWVRDTNKRLDRANRGNGMPSIIIGTVDAAYINGVPLIDYTTINGSFTVQPVSMPFGWTPAAGQQVIVRTTSLGWVITDVLATATAFPVQFSLASALAAGWVNYIDAPATQSNALNPAHRLTVSRTTAFAVKLVGMIYNNTGGTVAANAVLFNLPAAFRPLQPKRFVGYTTVGPTGIIVETNGNVYSDVAVTAGTGVNFSFEWTNDPNIVWTPLVLNAPWVQSTIPGAATCRVGKDTLGRVWFEGLAQAGTSATAIAPIPAGFRRTGVAGINGASLGVAYELSAANRYTRVEAPVSAGAGIAAVQNIGDALLVGTSTGHSLDSANYMADTVTYEAVPLVTGSSYLNGYDVLGSILLSDGTVLLKGMVTGQAANGTITILPPGHRPLIRELMMCELGNAMTLLAIEPTGVVYNFSSASATFQSLENVRFAAEQ